jgi:hypothetical protein
MASRRRAVVALVASSALLLGSGVAFAMTRDAGVGTDLAQVTSTRTAADLTVSRGPSRPATDVPVEPKQEVDNAPPVADVPLTDATQIVIDGPPAAPSQLRIDGVDVSMPIAATGVQSDGQMELPDDPSVIGWYKFGAAPGDRRGSAVLGGHVDSVDEGIGPLVRLASVQVGERVVVTDGEGRPVAYQVSSVQRITKSALPVDTLFRPGGRHQLVVITCGGRYLADAGGYEDNIVVLARPVGS